MYAQPPSASSSPSDLLMKRELLNIREPHRCHHHARAIQSRQYLIHAFVGMLQLHEHRSLSDFLDGVVRCLF